MANQSSNQKPKKDSVHPKKFDIRNAGATKGKSYSKKEAALRPPLPVSDINRKERIYNGMETAKRKPAPVFDLNQKVRTFNGKEAALQTSAPIFDLNQKERIYSGKDATKRNTTPVFDLNQISVLFSDPGELKASSSHFAILLLLLCANVFIDFVFSQREEEELQADCEPSKADEPKRSLLRGGSDEQLNDMKLSICRNIGNGPSRAGKRKISWQDQVALRV
jgi:hypothetical protein